MKWGLMRQVVLLVAATLLINAVIMTVMFTTTSRNVYANMRLDELLPHANYVGALTSLYHQGGLSMNVFEMLINQDTNLRNMDIYIFHSDGTLLASPVQAKNSIDKTELQQYALSVMDKESENSDAPTGEGVAVGVPVYGSDGEAVGAVVAVRSILELDAALSGLNRAVLASTTVAMLIMLIPVFFASRRISNPLRQMSTVARAMSEGDFSIKAAETNRGEVGALGTSLNELSEKLSRSIGDLVLERNRLQNVIDGLQEGIIAIDANNEITHFNPAAIILLDGTEDMDIIDLPQVKSLIDDAKATVEDGEQRDRQISVGDTEITVTTTQLLNQRGSSAGAVLLLQDVTRAVRLEQTRREYVANVSHELRTPIASIRGLADALNDGMVKKEEDKQRYYGYILRESMRLSRLINDLLELSRLQSGGMALKKEKVNMHDLMRELKDRFSEVAEECGLTFVCDCREKEWHARMKIEWNRCL